LQASLHFVKQVKLIDYVVVGFNNFNQFKEIVFNYKKEVTLAVLFNILTAIFTVLSAPLISPFLDILFLDSSQASHFAESPMLEQEKWFKQQLLYFIAQNGKMKALQYVCFAILGVFLLKNVSRYFALFFMAPVRNGVV
jgi:subfamily B ATP-binding cassette protein MsbA